MALKGIYGIQVAKEALVGSTEKGRRNSDWLYLFNKLHETSHKHRIADPKRSFRNHLVQIFTIYIRDI